MSMVMNRVVALSQRLRRPGRFYPDAARDIFLVTYPRSGTTWISCVAAELLFQTSPKSLTEIGWFVPDMHDLPEKSVVPPAGAYLVKSHFPLDSLHGIPLFGDYRRVIYLLRDPRDVMLSHHRYVRYLSRYTGDLKEFGLGRGTYMALLLERTCQFLACASNAPAAV
jgi:hypothetical protein